MSCEIEIGNGGGAGKTRYPGLSRDLCPPIGRTPLIASPLLNRLRSGLYFSHNSLLEMRDEGRRLADEVLGEFVFNFSIPIRAELVGGLTAQAECVLPLGGMGWIDFRRSEEVKGSLL